MIKERILTVGYKNNLWPITYNDVIVGIGATRDELLMKPSSSREYSDTF